MSEKVVARFKGELTPTGKTTHNVNGLPVDNFDELRVIQFSANEFNLLYFENGREVTDTGHASLVEALEQAEFEFSISPTEWVLIQ